jgi:purine catabolism regulator
MRQRAMRDTERRLAGDVLAEALAGQLDAGELGARLRPFGVGAEAAVLVFSVPDPRAAEADLDRAIAAAGQGALVASRQGLLCAVVEGEGLEPIELAGRARAALAERHGEVAAAASRVAAATELRRSFHEARCALEAAALAPRNGRGPEHVASYRDLGSFQLLLSLQDDDALRLYCDSVLGPLENGGNGEYGDELVRSLEVFIEQNGQWERAARELFCHRHTLRYRIRRIEELTGRDLSSARDRIEFWLALRGRELVS